ncbi:L,D-transpeptidase family protein [Pseudofulvibacter geojedonensis]|uniref:Murein L,D-transpeptidase family protein n=1 Tax=Pseudofulvibacter geojedonensis TaxID=1123758 RepID=A0ABW3HZV2_9FLAO
MNDSFKQNQLNFPRVKEAYQIKHLGAQTNLKKHGLNPNQFHLYIRVFKHDGIVELWGKNPNQNEYTLFREYDICAASGDLGPKRKQGDYQVPEGFYHIDRFNPKSKFHLSLGVNYPNASDKILSHQQKPGGDIFIHGDCQTIGCIPITNNEIKSFYVYCVEAINNGQKKIPVTFFPAKMEGDNLLFLKEINTSSKTKQLWKELEKGYQYFNEYKQLPTVSFLNNGRHLINGK